jgi:hypothetical protein
MKKIKLLGLLSILTLSTSAYIFSCVPNSSIPTMMGQVNPDPNNPLPTLGPDNPTNPNNGDPNATPNPSLPPVNPTHPPPPDPQQPTTEDDFWKLMARFGFMQTRTKDALLADIKKGLVTKISDWSPGQVGDKSKNVAKRYTDNKKYFNPAISDQTQYLQKSLALANDNPKNVDFYLDVEYGAKDGKGVIIMQRINPSTLEVLYFNNKGLITNYTQTSKPKTGGPPPLLRLTHFMFIPPSVYQ